MKLKCQSKGAKCPPYKHHGIFRPDDETLKQFEPDLKRCATCMAYTPPRLPSLQDDLLQIARITLWKKGTAFNPEHESGASFGSFIRPQICGRLMNAKREEHKHFCRSRSLSYPEDISQRTSRVKANRDIRPFLNTSDSQTGFEDTLVWELWNADFEQALPQLLQRLTPRERQVFNLIRQNTRNCDIAKTLQLSKGRVSQLVEQVELKLSSACQTLGLTE